MGRCSHHPPYGKATATASLGLAVLVLLSGCAGGLQPPSMFRFGQGAVPSDPVIGPSMPPEGSTGSGLIDDLRTRRSILPVEGPYAEVASAVIDAASGASAAELRMARLKAEAKAKNWLPSIGPVANLTSLGSVVAQLVVEQAVFDNGRRKAERDFAAADVELAAVKLATDLNQRVFDGLSHYLDTQRAREQAQISSRAADRLSQYAKIVAMRVDGGLSDRSEQQVIAQKRSEMQATLAADRQAEAQAMAELSAMTSRRLDDLAGLQQLPEDMGTPEPLSVLQRRSEGARDLAESRINRASMLPGITASAGIDNHGDTTTGLRLGGTVFNFGNGAALRALDGTADLVTRRTAESRQAAQRQFVTDKAEINGLMTRQADGQAVLKQTLDNLGLFTEQYRAGRRSLLELVSQYDAAARLERDQAALKYEIARLRLKMARDRGVLVDGVQM
jgi:outer membrane protein, adhesin transport system